MHSRKAFLFAAFASLMLPAAESRASAAPAAPAVHLAMPAMAGPLGLNTHPMGFNAGMLGHVFVTGAASGIGLAQKHARAADASYTGDIANGMVFVQNAGSPVQFFVQGGVYALPRLGMDYRRASETTRDTFGYVPQAYLKVAPNDSISVMAGKLPTLIGNEFTFTFQNMNIQRGLLWNQENAVNRGVQANVAAGPWNAALSWNDGFYSGKYTWLTGLMAYAIDENNAVAVAGGGNLGQSARNTAATPRAQNNSSIVNLIYTHTAGPWTFSPYLQYTYVKDDPALGYTQSAETQGAALLANYEMSDSLSLAARAEYIAASGTPGNGAADLLYGEGSRAWSFTLTPTYRMGLLFARAEASYVRASRIVAGRGFGDAGNDDEQARLLLEAGMLF
jgi:hypothetical protein